MMAMTVALTGTLASAPEDTSPWLDGYPLVGQTVLARRDGRWEIAIVAVKHARYLDPGDVVLVIEASDEVTILNRCDVRPTGHPTP